MGRAFLESSVKSLLYEQLDVWGHSSGVSQSYMLGGAKIYPLIVSNLSSTSAS